VAVLIHGGFWREPYRRDLMAPLAADLVGRGLATANLEYRRVGGTGGWPGTLADVAAGIDHLADLDDPRLDLDRVTAIGHSAGGHLAVWAAVRTRLAAGRLGAGPRVRPAAVVTLAGVNDLGAAAADGLGDGATQALLGGGPDTVPDRYEVADPARHLPPPVRLLAVHGDADRDVPREQSERFVTAVRAHGGDAELALVPGGHLDVIDPASPAWERVVAFLTAGR
jgi:acetyl esterase/lipase